MSDVLLVYWSGTGNTKVMAELIQNGIEAAGKSTDSYEVGEVKADIVDSYSNIVLGCPSMGAEVLEEEEMEPFVAEIESKVAGKKVALFGSYGWGDGEWMRDWQERMAGAGADMLSDEGLIVMEAPEGDECIDYGKEIAGKM